MSEADPNLILRSVQESARAAYKTMIAGQSRTISCSKSLLDRGDEQPQAEEPYARLTSWAKAGGLEVAQRDGTVTVTIRRKAA